MTRMTRLTCPLSRLQDGASYDIKSAERTRYIPTQQGDLEMKNIFAVLFSAVLLLFVFVHPLWAQVDDMRLHARVCMIADNTFTDADTVEVTDNGTRILYTPGYSKFWRLSRTPRSIDGIRLCVERAVGSQHKFSFFVDGREIVSGTIVVQNRPHWVTVSKNRNHASDEVTISSSFQEPKSVLKE